MNSIAIKFPNGTEVTADFVKNGNGILADNLWNLLADGPEDFVCHHTGSTGGLINAYPLPRKEYMYIKAPENLVLAGELGGMITWNGFDMLLMHETCTEPLLTNQGEIARVREEDMEAYMKACKDVWYHCYLYHKLAVITVRRKED